MLGDLLGWMLESAGVGDPFAVDGKCQVCFKNLRMWKKPFPYGRRRQFRCAHCGSLYSRKAVAASVVYAVILGALLLLGGTWAATYAYAGSWVRLCLGALPGFLVLFLGVATPDIKLRLAHSTRVFCKGCGYDLRGRSETLPCPECGIVRTQVPRPNDGLITHSDAPPSNG